MKRNHWRLDRESQESAAKQPHHDVATIPLMPVQVLPDGRGELSGLRHLRQFKKVEAAAGEKESKEGKQQGDAAHHGVNKELGRGARPPRAAPQPDHEKRRNQAQLPEKKPVKKIQCRKRAEQPCLQKQQQAKVGRSLFGLLQEATAAMSTTMEETASISRLNPSRPTW